MAEQPNLLLIITDQQSYDTLGAYGNNQIQTPNLDSLAEQSYIFENTYGHTLILGRNAFNFAKM